MRSFTSHSQPGLLLLPEMPFLLLPVVIYYSTFKCHPKGHMLMLSDLNYLFLYTCLLVHLPPYIVIIFKSIYLAHGLLEGTVWPHSFLCSQCLGGGTGI